MGAEEAKIIVSPLIDTTADSDDATNLAKYVLETLIFKMGVSATVVPQYVSDQVTAANSPLAFDIKGDDLGILIGRQGQTLSCLQYITKLILARQMDNWVPITIDVEGYKQRRYEALKALALRLAEQVKNKRRSFTLEPMPAHERRIIHLALADHPDVTTQSISEGFARKVVISPKNK